MHYAMTKRIIMLVQPLTPKNIFNETPMELEQMLREGTRKEELAVVLYCVGVYPFP